MKTDVTLLNSMVYHFTAVLGMYGNYGLIALFSSVVMVIYYYVEIIGELSLPPILRITYTIMKNIIQANELIYIYNN